MNLVWIHFRTTSLSQHHWIHCTVARELWDLVLGLVGVKWVFPNTVKEVLYSWGGSQQFRGLNILLFVIFGVGLNCIWKRSRIPFQISWSGLPPVEGWFVFWFFVCFWPLLPGIRPVYVGVFLASLMNCACLSKKKKTSLSAMELFNHRMTFLLFKIKLG